MNTIYIDTIPHHAQRYPTVGDWYFLQNLQGEPASMRVHVSEMGNADYEFLVAIHEQIEAYLCHKRGIEEHEVTRFDKLFEKNRGPEDTDEPGNDPSAPYHKEHVFATGIERQLAAELGVDWDTYDNVVNSL